jgi:hypothetical protein
VGASIAGSASLLGRPKGGRLLLVANDLQTYGVAQVLEDGPYVTTQGRSSADAQ